MDVEVNVIRGDEDAIGLAREQIRVMGERRRASREREVGIDRLASDLRRDAAHKREWRSEGQGADEHVRAAAEAAAVTLTKFAGTLHLLAFN